MFRNLINLIKYDLKFVYKQLIIFYIITLGCAIIARLTNIEDSSFFVKFIHEFTQGATFGFSFGAMANATIRMWARFRANLYGDESYLTHTLPISKNTLWASKFLASVIISAFSIIMILLAVVVLFYPIDLKDFGIPSDLIAYFWKVIIAFIVVVITQFIFIFNAGFTGVLLGHRANNHRQVLSVLIGFGVYLLGGAIIIGCMFIWSQFNTSANLIFRGKQYESELLDYWFDEEGNVHTIEDRKKVDVLEILCGIGLFYMALIIINYFINQKLLKSGVNVE